ncbi:MAG: hypothetical protein NVSMB52_05300 [Chloroflexota bacterium]
MKLLLLASLLLTSAGISSSRLIFGVGGHKHVIAITFDAGADRGRAAAILTTLERDHVHSSFGMTGRWAHDNPDLVRRMAKDRDTFINHTYDHRSFTGFSSHAGVLSSSQRMWEITQTERTVKSLTGQSTKPYFRPPYGDYDAPSLALAQRLGYRLTIMWTVDSLGWQHLSPAAIESRCLTLARPGGIILMHVGIQSEDALALHTVITMLKRRGYSIVTVPELLSSH